MNRGHDDEEDGKDPRKEFYPIKETCHSLKNFCQDLSLTQVRDIHFLKSEWENFQNEPLVSQKYIIYRGIFMVLFIFILVFSFSCSYLKEYYFIFLTHWSLCVQVIYSILFFIRVILGAYGKWKVRPLPKGEYHDYVDAGKDVPDASRASQNSTTKGIVVLQAVIWVLQPTCCVMSIVVTIGFWATIFKEDDYTKDKVMSCEFPTTCLVHGVNAILAYIDLGIVSIPVHVTHFIYVAAYGLTYCLFSGLYEVANGNYPVYRDEIEHNEFIYSILNWRASPGSALVTTLIAVVGALFLFLFIYLLYALRLFLVSIRNPLIYFEHIYDHKGDPCLCSHPHTHGHGFTCEECRLAIDPEHRVASEVRSLSSAIGIRKQKKWKVKDDSASSIGKRNRKRETNAEEHRQVAASRTSRARSRGNLDFSTNLDESEEELRTPSMGELREVKSNQSQPNSVTSVHK